MASPAPAATLCQLARRGWPLAVAVLLTLLLGWSALHEGRGHGPAAHGWQAHAEDLHQATPLPAPPADECPQHAVPAPEPPLDGEGTSPCTGMAPARAILVAHIPLWRSDALRWQLRDPALRLNPGHAPPAPHAS